MSVRKKLLLATTLLLAAAGNFVWTSEAVVNYVWPIPVDLTESHAPDGGAKHSDAGRVQDAADAAAAQQGNVAGAPMAQAARERLWPQLRAAYDVMSGRDAGSGKERLTLVARLSHPDRSQTSVVQVISEAGGRLRVEESAGGGRRVKVYDGASGAAGDGDPALLATLADDSVEHFFDAQLRGAATRFLGSRFRLDDGTAADYAGPFYDVYEVTEPYGAGGETRRKFYYLNSETQLLERVRYEEEAGGASVRVEVVNDAWRLVAGRKVPGLITRLVNDAPVLALSVEAAKLGGAVRDGAFDKPGAR